MNVFESFERAKLRRFIARWGKPYKIQRHDLNDYGEPTIGFSVVASIKGVYHEARHSYMEENAIDSGLHTQEIESLLLCMIDEDSNRIVSGDYLFIGEKRYVVTKKKDVNNFGLGYDISLEYKDDATGNA